MPRLSAISAAVMPLLICGLVCAAPVRLRCEYRDKPIGIDVVVPHLSWQSDNLERNWTQSAYQILVAGTPEPLRAGKGDVWDSGKRKSSESVGIAYGGPKLVSSRRYYWTVRVWDATGKPSGFAEPAWFETGLLAPSDWKAKWISRPDPEPDADRASIRWIRSAAREATAVPVGTTVTFRLEADVPDHPRNAALYLLSRIPFTAKVNGRPAGAKDGRFLAFDRQDITDLLVAGRNSIEVTMTAPEPPEIFDPSAFDPPVSTTAQPPQPRPVRREPPAPVALAGLLKIVRADGSVDRMPTDPRWQTRFGADRNWEPAALIGDLKDSRMGPDPGPLPGPASLFRSEFTVTQPVKAARLYVTALGTYRATLNGTQIGSDLLTPEYTDYAKRVTYQTYDVTALVTSGRNAIGVMLGDGWFGSASTWIGVRYSFLPPPARLLAQLRIDYADGSRDTVVTDDTWKTAPAPILHSEIYAGEIYDTRLEQPEWDRPGFDDSRWTSAAPAPAPGSVVSAAVTNPPRVVETLRPKSMTPGPNGTYVFDMGQNMVGWVALRANGPAGTKVQLRFSEILNPDGTLYVQNLRNANQTDAFYLDGRGERTLEPHFTFHGFRYVEVTGYAGAPSLDAITGKVISSAQQLTGRLTTSSDLVNRMWKTGIWGQRGNFLSIPTDCPQRDERLGWTGDAQVFWRTGAYNADIAAFGRKWLRDLTDDQTEDGMFANTAPAMPFKGDFSTTGAPGWGDAGVIVPWTAWQQYGDAQIVRDNWKAMARWMDYIEKANPDYLRRKGTGANFADWLPAGSTTPRDLVATAYWAMIARMMAQMAHAIGEPADAKRYSQIYENIRAAFQKAFIRGNGEIGSGSQTSYVLALHMGLVPDSLKQTAAVNLVKDIGAHGWHLTTGFLGTPHLLFVLADNGRSDVAYRLLLNETYPSWGYMLSKGATTWWERWNGDSGDPAMNSYNHYAFGSVMAFVYRYVVGIDTALDGPGFRHIVIRPRIDTRMTHAGGEYDSVYGKIVTGWTRSPQGPFSLKVTIPANTRATVYLPGSEGSPTEIGSGTYEFQVK